jgi:hypothetical protein
VVLAWLKQHTSPVAQSLVSSHLLAIPGHAIAAGWQVVVVPPPVQHSAP